MENSIQTTNIDGIECYEKDGVAYLKLESVARGLGFTRTANSGNEVVRWETIRKYLAELGVPTSWHGENIQTGRDGLPNFIPENIFYRLSMKAKNDSAEAFQAKIADEIIPTIRKHGIYATEEVIDSILDNPDFGITLLTRLKEERAARVVAEKRNALLMHSKKTYTMTEIAKELHMRSASELNKVLAKNKIQYKVNNTWVFYSNYSNLGYDDIKQEILPNGTVVYHRKITQSGREFILNLLAN